MWSLVTLLVLFCISFGVEVGEVKAHKGPVDLLKKGSLKGVPVGAVKPVLEVGDLLRTRSKGYAKVAFVDGTEVEMYERTRLRVVDYVNVREVHVQRGIVKFEIMSQKGLKGYKIETPHAIIGVKGTVLWVYVFPGYTSVKVEEGEVEVKYKVERASSRLFRHGSLMYRKLKDPFGTRPPPVLRKTVEVILQ